MEGSAHLPPTASGQPGSAPQWLGGAWFKLKRAVDAERTQCWLLVAAAAIASMPLGWLVALPAWVAMSLIDLSQIKLDQAESFTALLTGLSSLITLPLMFIIPITLVVLAGVNYRRSRQLAQRDLVYGHIALMLIDEAYGQAVEQAASERYRPNPNRVDFGKDFIGRVNHFAHYYAAYYRLSWGPADVKVPFTIERNCWAEGLLMGGCMLPPLCLVGWLAILPLLFRAVFVWPKLLGIKQAVIDYLGGQQETALEQQYVSIS